MTFLIHLAKWKKNLMKKTKERKWRVNQWSNLRLIFVPFKVVKY
jgi:hypothetical protein